MSVPKAVQGGPARVRVALKPEGVSSALCNVYPGQAVAFFEYFPFAWEEVWLGEKREGSPREEARVEEEERRSWRESARRRTARVSQVRRESVFLMSSTGGGERGEESGLVLDFESGLSILR